MSDSIRAALERLIARLDETADPDGPVPAWVDSYCAARAALAAAPEGEGPADEELALIYHDCCRGCEFMDQGGFEDGARAVLARWGRPADGYRRGAQLRGFPRNTSRQP